MEVQREVASGKVRDGDEKNMTYVQRTDQTRWGTKLRINKETFPALENSKLEWL